MDNDETVPLKTASIRGGNERLDLDLEPLEVGLKVPTTGVNRSPPPQKKRTSNKSMSLSLIWTLVCQAIFSWTIFGQPIGYSKVRTFFDLIGFWSTI